MTPLDGGDRVEVGQASRVFHLDQAHLLVGVSRVTPRCSSVEARPAHRRPRVMLADMTSAPAFGLVAALVRTIGNSRPSADVYYPFF